MTNSAQDDIRAQLDIYKGRLTLLIQRGLEVRDAIAADAAKVSALATARAWQQDCGTTVNELSGGSKSHWLARAFSEAFLVRESVESVPPAEIVVRLIGVLEQAIASLSREDAAELLASSDAPAPHRFDFVHDPELRPILEQAYSDGRCAMDEAKYDLALRTYAGILEAIVTDALQHRQKDGLLTGDLPEGSIGDWPFEARLAVAENAGLIGRGAARLPEVARKYRELDEKSRIAIAERDARVTGQVLHVIMRDLNPGR